MARRDPMFVPSRAVLDRFPKSHRVHTRFTRLPEGHPLRVAYELLYAVEPEPRTIVKPKATKAPTKKATAARARKA